MARRILRLDCLEHRLAPATWDGGGADNNWTTAANWVGDVAPIVADSLVFPAGAAQLTNVNNFAAGTLFASLSVTAGGYVINGNAVTLATGITADIPGGESSTLGLPLDGAGGLSKTSPGTLVLGAANSYLGVTTISNGTVGVRTNTALGSSGAGNETIVADGATLRFDGHILNIPESITITEPETAGPNAPALRLQGFEAVTLSGPLTVAATPDSNAAIVLGDTPGTSLFISSGVGESGGGGDIRFNSLSISFDPSSVNTLTGQTLISDGAHAQFNGQGGPSPVSNLFFAVIGGTGTVGPVTLGGPTGDADISAADESRVGTLTTGNLNLQATLPPISGAGRLIVNLASPGGVAAVDRINVNGTVQLGGVLILQPAPGLVLPPNGHFIIIANDGADPVVGTFRDIPEGETIPLINGNSVRITYHGGDGNDVELTSAPAPQRYAVARGPGSSPQVNVYDQTGFLYSIMAYSPVFGGGVRVAMGDINGDGVPELVTAPGPTGGPDIRVFDGVTHALINEFLAYDLAFTGGVFVALGDVNGDNFLDIVTGAGAGGGPHVKAFFGTNGVLVSSFFAYAAAFTGGVTVAAGDVTGDGIAEIITGPGTGGGPHVRVFNAAGGVVNEFLAYDAAFFGGIFVAAGDIDGDSKADIITSAGKGGGPHVKAFNGLTSATIASFLAYDPNFRGGVTVAAADLDGDGRAEILTGAGPGGGPHVKGWRFPGPTVNLSFLAFDPAFTGGVFVG
jgi:autotransporter-associated beta strand protein